MKHLIKVFAFVMFFSSTLAVAQSNEEVVKEAEKKAEKVYKMDDDKRVYKTDKKHLATKMTAEQKISVIDTNKDGKISVEEASKAENKGYSKHFATIDTNADGFIDLTEMKAKMAKKKEKMKTKTKMEY